MAAPVTKSEAAAARKTAMPARSRGVPQRPACVRRSTLVLRAGSPGLKAVAQSNCQKLPTRIGGAPLANVHDIRAVMYLYHQFILRVLRQRKGYFWREII